MSLMIAQIFESMISGPATTWKGRQQTMCSSQLCLSFLFLALLLCGGGELGELLWLIDWAQGHMLRAHHFPYLICTLLTLMLTRTINFGIA